MKRVAVLASGNGTNCQALLDACSGGTLQAEIACVVSDNASAEVLNRARKAGVPAVVVEHRGTTPEQRRHSDDMLTTALAPFAPDLIVLAGWMRILGDRFCRDHRVVNLHPALPGAFPGVDAITKAFDSWSNGATESSGVMVHWVPDSGVDVGPVIIVSKVDFEPDETLESFETKIHIAEHLAIVAGVREALAQIDRL